MSKVKSVTGHIRRELKAAGYDTHVSGKMGDTVLIEITGSAIDIAVYKSQKGDFEVKLGHADKFRRVLINDIVRQVDLIQKPPKSKV